MQPAAFSRHGGFFASLQRVEDRLASESEQPQEEAASSESMTGSPLVFLDPAAAAATTGSGSSGPALDLLSLTRQDQRSQEDDDEDDIARLMALLGLSPPPRDDDGSSRSGGCDCSGAEGFLGKVVGVVGPKCGREQRRLHAWIQHYRRRREEPARLAHLLLAMAASCSDDDAVAFPATVKGFLDRDAPPQEQRLL